MIGANMRCKRFVALQFEVAHHFFERCADGRTRRMEPPATFGATKTPKARLFYPYQFPAHGDPRRRALLPASSVPWPLLVVKGRIVGLTTTSPHRKGCYPDCRRNLWRSGSCMAHPREAYMCQSGWSVGHPTYLRHFLFNGSLAGRFDLSQRGSCFPCL